MAKLRKDNPARPFYEKCNLILAFKVKDEYTQRSFFYVTNA